MARCWNSRRVTFPSALKRYCRWLAAGYDIISGPQISSSVGGLITCTWPQRCPELFPVSRNHRPPGHGSSLNGNGLPSGIWLSGPSCSSIASKAISIGAAISSSRRISNVSTDACSVTMVLLLLPLLRGLFAQFTCFSLGSLLDAVELMIPKIFEGFYPVVHHLEPR